MKIANSTWKNNVGEEKNQERLKRKKNSENSKFSMMIVKISTH
jgi:hypothetical protein